MSDIQIGPGDQVILVKPAASVNVADEMDTPIIPADTVGEVVGHPEGAHEWWTVRVTRTYDVQVQATAEYIEPVNGAGGVGSPSGRWASLTDDDETGEEE